MGARNSHPIAHELLAAAGVTVPRETAVSGRFGSARGVRLDTDQAEVTPGTDAVAHDGVVYLVDTGGFGVKGKLTCACAEGSGTCNILSTETTSGNPAATCWSDGCTRCTMAVSIPVDQLAGLAIRALGIQLDERATVVGDIVRGAAISAGAVAIGDDSAVHIEEEEGVAYLVSQSTGVTIGSFDCTCSGEGGSCEISVSTDRLICQPRDCTDRCSMKITIPALQFSLRA
jgi:hypothetical protein